MMPLLKGKSDKAFSHNVRAEMHAGKPQKQSLAIAYAMKRKKAAYGSMMSKGGEALENALFKKRHKQREELSAKRGEEYGKEQGVHAPSYSSGRTGGKGDSIAGDNVRRAPYHRQEEALGYAKDEHRRVLKELQQDKHDRKYMAEGGQIPEASSHQSSCDEHCLVPCEVHPMAEPMEHSLPPDPPHSQGMSMDLNQREHEQNQGDMNSENPRVMRIMMSRAQGYSEGGKVANEDHGRNDSRLAGFSQNEFDDLTLRDDLHPKDLNTQGDQLGDAQEDHDRKDIVARIMRSRAKKDRMPNPA